MNSNWVLRLRFIGYTVCALVSFASHAGQMAATEPHGLKLNDTYIELAQKLEADPHNLALKMDLAYVFSLGRETERAIALYREVIAAEPDNLRATIELCALTASTNQDRPNPYCKRATELDPQNPLMWDNLGLSAMLHGNWPLALDAFFEGLERAPAKDRMPLFHHMVKTLVVMHETAIAQDLLLANISEQWPATTDDQAMAAYLGYEIGIKTKNYPAALTHMRDVMQVSNNPLYLGKLVTTVMRCYQVPIFWGVSLVLLLFARYLGNRLNRFLKNEI